MSNLIPNRLNFCRLLRRATLLVAGGLLALPGRAQTSPTVSPAPTRQYLVFRGGYTAGRFAHSTDDYRPVISLFGSGNSRTGQPVEHRFDGVLLGADFAQETYFPNRKRTLTVLGGLDVLGAADRLAIGDGRRARLMLGAVHPHFELGLGTPNWQFRGGAGLLLGRVGYYGSTSFDLFANTTIVDTVRVVPTFQTRVGWRNWVLAESGYGANGLLGLANPVWQAGIGTGFGPRSPVTLLVGVTEPESADFANQEYGHGYVRLEVAPASSAWRASGFSTFGSESYGRVALQVAYRLPLHAAPAAR